MRLFRDCFGCLMTLFLIGIIALGSGLYFGVPAVLDVIQNLAATG